MSTETFEQRHDLNFSQFQLKLDVEHVCYLGTDSEDKDDELQFIPNVTALYIQWSLTQQSY